MNEGKTIRELTKMKELENMLNAKVLYEELAIISERYPTREGIKVSS